MLPTCAGDRSCINICVANAVLSFVFSVLNKFPLLFVIANAFKSITGRHNNSKKMSNSQG